MKLLFFSLFIIGVILQTWRIFIKDKSAAKQILSFSLIIVGAGGFFIDLAIKEKKEKETALEGHLEPRKSYESDFIMVYLGSNRHSWPKSHLKNGLAIYPLGQSAEMKLEYSDGNLLLSTTVRSLDDKIVAVIEKNNWKVNPNNYFDRNYDDTAIEVIDVYGSPILQVELFDQNEIRICGIFRKDSSFQIVGRTGSAKYEGRPDKLDTKKVISERSLDFERLFVYGKGSLGQRTDYGKALLDAYYEKLVIRGRYSSEYAVLNEQQLGEETTRFVAEMRGFLRQQFAEIYSTGKESIRQIYKEDFKIKAIILKNELSHRLPKECGSSLSIFTYEDPHIFNIPKIAAELEILVRNLMEHTQLRVKNEYKIFSFLFPDAQTLNKKNKGFSAAENDINTLLLSLNVRNTDYMKLNQKYPFGYVLFAVKNTTLIAQPHIPPQSLLSKNYYINWKRLRVKGISNSKIGVSICDYNFMNTFMGGFIDVIFERGNYKETLQLTAAELAIFTELLTDQSQGIMFLLGFKKAEVAADAVPIMTKLGEGVSFNYGVVLGTLRL